METWYLSFADENGFKGGVVIGAVSFMDAVARSHRLRINPGGEVEGHQLPAGLCDIPSRLFFNKLLCEADLALMWPEAAEVTAMERLERQEG